MNEKKCILITGASSGIGAETARVLARTYGTVLLLARSKDKLEALGEEIKKNGGSAQCYPVDLSDSKQVEATADRIKKDVGIPDVIINNAGIGKWLPLEDTCADEAQQMMALPYLAAFNLTRCFITEMRERGTGQIINLTSDASFLPKGNAIAYSAARYALRGFSEALRGALVDTNITVSLATFGKVSSSYWENNPGSEENIPAPTPFMRTLTTNEVAHYLLDMIIKKKKKIVKPGIFRFLFFVFRHWPDQISRVMNKK